MRIVSSFLFCAAILASASAVSADGFGGILRGSRAAMARENAAADRHDLRRYKHSGELRAAIESGMLVKIPDTEGYFLDPTLGEADVPFHARLYRHARPWVKSFLDDVARDLKKAIGVVETLKITSLVRTETYQELLMLRNPNAARGATADTRSSHLTGSTVDISTKEMSPKVRAWLRQKLAVLEMRGLVQATEERKANMCFHVMVFPEYAKR